MQVESLLQTILARLTTLEESMTRLERHVMGPSRQDLGRAAAARERERFLQRQAVRPPAQPPTIVFHDVHPPEYVWEFPIIEQRPANGLTREWLQQLYTCSIAHLSEQDCLEKTGMAVEQLQQTNCSICLEEGFVGEICILPCKHVFHKECIDDWLQRRPTCPSCRFSFAET